MLNLLKVNRNEIKMEKKKQETKNLPKQWSLQHLAVFFVEWNHFVTFLNPLEMMNKFLHGSQDVFRPSN